MLFALIGAFIVFAQVTAACLKNRSQLDVALAEIRSWERVKVRISVGGTTLISADLDGFRYQALRQAQEQGRPLDFGQPPPGILPPLIVNHDVVVTNDGQGWLPYGGVVGQLTPVLLYLDCLPVPMATLLPLYDARLATWWPADDDTHDSTRSDSDD